MSLTLLAATPFPLFLLMAAGWDLTRYLIPNRMSLGLIGGFAVAFLISGLGWADLWDHVQTALIALAVGFALFALRVWGAGDGKFLPAALLWLDPSAALSAAFYIPLIGGALALIMILLRKAIRSWPIMATWSPAFYNIFSKPQILNAPYGAAIALGALLAFPQSDLFKALAGLL